MRSRLLVAVALLCAAPLASCARGVVRVLADRELPSARDEVLLSLPFVESQRLYGAARDLPEDRLRFFEYFRLPLAHGTRLTLTASSRIPGVEPAFAFVLLQPGETPDSAPRIVEGASPFEPGLLAPGVYFVGVRATCSLGRGGRCGSSDALPVRVRVVRGDRVQPPPAEQPHLVAVLPLDAGTALTGEETGLLEEALRTVAGEHFAGSGLTVLARETTLTLLADHGIDAERACDAATALAAARAIKAELFVSGSVAKEGAGLVAFLRVFDTASGRQLAALQLEGDSPRSLRRSFEEQAFRFFSTALDRRNAASP